MSTMTITEALAEIKLIDNKLKAHQEFILQHLYRNKALVDPLAEEGGSNEAVDSALQAMGDLRTRKVSIRAAINAANQVNTITCDGITHTIEEWLIWRRLVYPEAYNAMNAIIRAIHQGRTIASRAGDRLTAAQVQSADDIIVHLKEKEFVAATQAVQETYDRLDGLLSLKNAQITVDV